MKNQTDMGNSGGSGAFKRGQFRRYLLSGIAAAALIAAAPVVFHAVPGPNMERSAALAAQLSNQTSVALPDFTELVQKVKPAVVSVRVKGLLAAGNVPDDEEPNPFEGTPFEKFFHGLPQGNGHWHQMQPRRIEAQGSGFFISPDGYIVTNNHVVDDASEVQVVTDNGDTYEAKVIGKDKKTDLALIKVDSDKKFPYVTLATEKPKIGQWVVAMGNPFGLGGTVTAGIISAEGRDLGDSPYEDFLQIDAPINRGNSGGPTFNLRGEVAGVNTAIYSPSGGSVGIAFDIPASTVASVIPQLEKNGFVRRGWLGVAIQPVTKDIADSLGMKNGEGALVSEPQPGSPAAAAGLKSGDVITAVDNEPIKDARSLARKIAAMAPGSQVSLKIWRDGKLDSLTLTIGQLKEPNVRNASNEPSDENQVGKLGLSLAPAQDVEGAGNNGLAIVGVAPGGEAANLGMAEGDVILKAGGKPVSTPSEFKEALQAAKRSGRGHTLVLLKHHKNEIYLAVPVSAG